MSEKGVHLVAALSADAGQSVEAQNQTSKAAHSATRRRFHNASSSSSLLMAIRAFRHSSQANILMIRSWTGQ